MSHLKTAAVISSLAWMALGQTAEARPAFVKEFWNRYSQQLSAHNTQKCSLCHEGQNKKVRNNYGSALADKLGAKNVKNSQQIQEALKETEKEPSAIPGKTFGDLINEGKLPASK